MTLQGFRTEHGLEGGELEALLGDRRALDHLFSVTYEELRRLASSVRRSDANASLSPTTLVNEAWLKLRNSPRLAGVSRLHFTRIAARAMRQVLIEAARRRNAQKRGGGLRVVTLDDDAADQTSSAADELLGLDAALEELARLQPRQALVVETRFFGGLDVAASAELLGVSDHLRPIEEEIVIIEHVLLLLGFDVGREQFLELRRPPGTPWIRCADDLLDRHLGIDAA